MEKFGLFDLIDKFNAVANGKNDFAKRKDNSSQPTNQNGGGNGGNGGNSGANGGNGSANGGNGNGCGSPQQKLVDPQIFPPPQYMMNAKLRDFNKKHDEFSRRVLPPQ